MHTMLYSPKRAFSLVELSIVLVILGLLVGGVLAGQSLIRAAELRAVSSEFNRYVAATQTFRDKYFALPGDITNATAFWGQMTNCGVASPSGTGTQTCDGNGDGWISYPSAASRTGEMFGFWKHLANAGLIEGTYTGIAGTTSATYSVIGENVPASKLSRGGWTAWLRSTTTGNGSYFDHASLNMFSFGAQDNDEPTYARILKPEELWNIDTKVDDGKPARGTLVAVHWSGCTDAANSAALDSNYLLTNSAVACAAYFKF